MSEVVRLMLVSHAMTDAMSAGRFPADEPLNGLGHRQLDGSLRPDEFGAVDATFCGPEARTRQTAEALELAAEIEPRIGDLDCGNWSGRALEALDHTDLAVWMTEPAQAPHGGESIVDVIDRVRGWLASLNTGAGRVAAVTHPAVVRAAILIALDAPPKSFWRIDIAPASRTVLHRRGNVWTLRATG